MSYRVLAQDRADRYRVSVEEDAAYQRQGYLLARRRSPRPRRSVSTRWISSTVASRSRAWSRPRRAGRRRTSFTAFARPPIAPRRSSRRTVNADARVLDVLEALIGPDVLALQTMLFYNLPGRGGQGWHQDSYYITTYPDTLIGALIALDAADEENGCLWVAPGSRCEAIYPSPDPESGFVHSDGAFADLDPVESVSHLDDDVNTLSPVARRYEWVARAGGPGKCHLLPGATCCTAPTQTGAVIAGAAPSSRTTATRAPGCPGTTARPTRARAPTSATSSPAAPRTCLRDSEGTGPMRCPGFAHRRLSQASCPHGSQGLRNGPRLGPC